MWHWCFTSIHESQQEVSDSCVISADHRFDSHPLKNYIFKRQVNQTISTLQILFDDNSSNFFNLCFTRKERDRGK